MLLLAPGRSRQQIMSWAIYHGLKRTKQAKATAQSQATKGKSKRSGKQEKQPATPVLNARVSAKVKSAGLSPIGRMLEQMRKLLPSHPRRMAYALAARTGTGQDAYRAWVNWKPSVTEADVLPAPAPAPIREEPTLPWFDCKGKKKGAAA
ncbi:hypothetical protein [Hymenobacter cheonanensis]|uniref:hypothetical protein n=1 Tax=Hymenobacter sp. CA2-7 TaxID=3063993 RepID=UPI00272C4BF3|nr:hypothetical protein [Hymenobacter sp. CA2-7]